MNRLKLWKIINMMKRLPSRIGIYWVTVPIAALFAYKLLFGIEDYDLPFWEMLTSIGTLGAVLVALFLPKWERDKDKKELRIQIASSFASEIKRNLSTVLSAGVESTFEEHIYRQVKSNMHLVRNQRIFNDFAKLYVANAEFVNILRYSPNRSDYELLSGAKTRVILKLVEYIKGHPIGSKILTKKQVSEIESYGEKVRQNEREEARIKSEYYKFLSDNNMNMEQFQRTLKRLLENMVDLSIENAKKKTAILSELENFSVFHQSKLTIYRQKRAETKGEMAAKGSHRLGSAGRIFYNFHTQLKHDLITPEEIFAVIKYVKDKIHSDIQDGLNTIYKSKKDGDRIEKLIGKLFDDEVCKLYGVTKEEIETACTT